LRSATGSVLDEAPRSAYIGSLLTADGAAGMVAVREDREAAPIRL
jgi:hypothetical protein